MLSIQEILQQFSEFFYTRIKSKFLSKEEAINGILLEQGWQKVDTVNSNEPISLINLDGYDELYIEMSDSDGTIVHNTIIRRESLLFESTNTEYREILLDSMHNSQSYVTYDITNKAIIPSYYEGELIDENSDVITSVYIKGNEITSTAPSSIITYDNTESGLESNSVQGAIDEVTRTLGYTVTSKNLLPYPYYNTTLQSQSVHFTDNGDGTVTINGTATGDAIFQLKHREYDYLTLKTDSYTVTGVPKNSNGVQIRVLNSDGEIIAVDEGNGANLTINETENIGSYIFVASGTTVNNLVIEPMISKEGGEYEPYVADVKTQIDNNKLDTYEKLLDISLSESNTEQVNRINNYRNYNGIFIIVTGGGDSRLGTSIYIPKAILSMPINVPIYLEGTYLAGYTCKANGYFNCSNGNLAITTLAVSGWSKLFVTVYGLK